MSFTNHPEWTTENSLTDPLHQTEEYMNSSSKNQGVVLSEPEIQEAINELNINKPIEKFRKIEKFYADPPIQGQQIALFSFTPARGAEPDEAGVYGMIKCRGVFATQREANERAEFLFRNVDTYHKVFHCQVGRPFPITFNEYFFEEKSETDLKNKVKEVEGEFLKMSREEEEAVLKGLKDRIATIKEEAINPKPPSKTEEYVTLHVKRATLFNHIESLKAAMAQYQTAHDSLCENIRKYDEEYPEMKSSYMDEYMKEIETVSLNADPKFVAVLKNWN